jgi:hypothetical protein
VAGPIAARNETRRAQVVAPYNKQLQRTVTDKVPSHLRLRAAAELRRYASLFA